MLAAVINYCTKDFRFLEEAVKALAPITEQVVIPVCDHFFNGAPENQELLDISYARCPECDFIEYSYETHKPYGSYFRVPHTDKDWTHYMHSVSRYIGAEYVAPNIDYILFLDVDEIVDTSAMKKWLEQFPYFAYDAIRLEGYFYFRTADKRLTYSQPTALLAKRESLQNEWLLDIYERKGTFAQIGGKKLHGALDMNQKPMIHHYSWVRPKDDLFFKTSAWSHKHDRDWSNLIAHEFSQEFSERDTIFGGEYETITPLFDPLKVAIPKVPTLTIPTNVTKTNPQEINIRKIRQSLES